MLISFGFIYYCKVTALKISGQYPTVDCNTIDLAYGSELTKYAFIEYDRYYVTNKSEYFFTGPLICFCKEKGLTGLGKIDKTIYTYNGTTPPSSYPVC
jgi:hypothetical protein